MSANPKDERRAERKKLGSRVGRRAHTSRRKLKSGANRKTRLTPAQELRKAQIARKAGVGL